MDLLIVIPARYESTRFPGKPLALIAGVSLIERVYRLCCRVERRAAVIVATDDGRIERHVREFGGAVMMTRRDHPSGTDRVAEVARHFRCEIVINVQGDEPLLDPRVVRRLAAAMRADPSLSMATLCHAIRKAEDYQNPNVVKVVAARGGRALYFSRAPIPHTGKFQFPVRLSDGRRGGQADGADSKVQIFQRHIGIYAYRRDFLLRYVRWPQSPLEKAERLEQLRVLERGIPIRVLESDYEAIGVDAPADVRKVEKALAMRSK
ncbi:MAG: 3-deoxy-manno-octulosonate cytidylyltransferase [Verrucomicrobia bacterium]|nr:3-deoxy-manno-octulosonate cytidylyltransferase [Verrucomicrobiota bacterium]